MVNWSPYYKMNDHHQVNDNSDFTSLLEVIIHEQIITLLHRRSHSNHNWSYLYHPTHFIFYQIPRPNKHQSFWRINNISFCLRIQMTFFPWVHNHRIHNLWKHKYWVVVFGATVVLSASCVTGIFIVEIVWAERRQDAKVTSSQVGLNSDTRPDRHRSHQQHALIRASVLLLI